MSFYHIRDDHPKARKTYRCDLCGLKIEKGERHTKRTGNSDGDIFSFRMHTVCDDYTDKYWRYDDWECEPCESEFLKELKIWEQEIQP